MIKAIAAFATFTFFGLALSLAGTWDFEDAVAADAEYTMMVCAGHWPDYDNRNPDCTIHSLGR